MGLFDFLDKAINGAPLFDERSNESQSRQSDTDEPVKSRPESQDPTRTDRGEKIIPRIHVSRLSTRRNGDTMMTHVWIQNEAPFAIELRKVTIMGHGINLNYQLQPGHGREVLIYKGSVASHDKEHHANVDYLAIQNGDYFQQEFHVEFDRQSDGKFLIEELHPEEHVRDT